MTTEYKKVFFLLLVALVLVVLNGCSNARFKAEDYLLVGRFDLSSLERAKFTWPGSSVAFRFEGTKAGLQIYSEDRIRFQLRVDDEVSDFWIRKGEHFYWLTQDLKPGVHTVRLIRATESFTSVTAIVSSPKVDGVIINPPPAKNRRLLVFGDSITAGYGVEGESEKCSYAHDTSTALKAYAYLAANHLEADIHVIAWSGIGASRSYGEKTASEPTMLQRYDRVLAHKSIPRWSAEDFMPHAILVNIGTNDYWDGEAVLYPTAMHKFITQLQARYPEVPIYLLASPMLHGETHAHQLNVLKQLASTSHVTVLDFGSIKRNEEGLGCDYHPSVFTQQRIAKELANKISEDLGWPIE